MNLSIVIPYLYNETREPLFQLVKNYYEKQFPNAEIIKGIDDSTQTSFNRSLAIDNGVSEATNDIILINDGDIITPKNNILKGLELIKNTPFTIPFGRCYDITENKTKALLKYGLPNKLSKLDKHKYMTRDIRPGYGIFGLDKFAGGLQLIKKDFFHEIGGMEPDRFKTWGWEDSWFCARVMHRLGDYPILEDGICYHLYHDRIPPKEGWAANQNLFYELCAKEL